MGTKKWSEIKKLSDARVPFREAETDRPTFTLVTAVCGRQDLNLHVFRHQDLKPPFDVFLVVAGDGKWCLSWGFARQRVGVWCRVPACFAQFR